jgi:hypothetical protein
MQLQKTAQRMLGGIVLVLVAGLHAASAQQSKTFELLEDDFEAAEVGSTIKSSNVAWSGNDGSDVQAVIVDREPSKPPHEGSKRWAKLDRAASGRSEGHLSVVDLTLIGGRLHVRFKMCVVRNDADKFRDSAFVEVGIGSTLSSQASVVSGRGAGNRVASNDGDELNIDCGVTFKDDEWQNWQIWVDIDRKTFEYTVDDGRSGTLRLRDRNQPGRHVIKLIEIEPGTAGGTGKDAVV